MTGFPKKYFSEWGVMVSFKFQLDDIHQNMNGKQGIKK
jgi:hypothetical protein